ncbi:MAG: DUF4831 family protein [Bacteroidales bacterium]|nr:DUF4831 family protein [Bacteroidales bacterium]
MKNRISCFVFLFLSLQAMQSFGQFSVSRVLDRNVTTSQDGFFYALPQTVLEINLLVEKLEKKKGPLADFTEEYLGTDQFITSNSTSYRLLDVHIEPITEPDPGKVYYVMFPADRAKDAKPTGFSLSPQGILAAYDPEGQTTARIIENDINQTIIVDNADEGFNYGADYNRMKKVDTVIRKITIDTLTIDRFLFKTSWVDKSPEERANEAAKRIVEIRESRFNLISGFQEVNYGESIKYMDRQLRQLEREYLELFLGKETKSIESLTVYFTPSREKTSATLFRGTDGSRVELEIKSQGTTRNLPLEPLSKTDNIFYRIPESAVVEVTREGKVFYRGNFSLPQLGVVAAAPLNRSRLHFDPKTGALVKIVRE